MTCPDLSSPVVHKYSRLAAAEAEQVSWPIPDTSRYQCDPLGQDQISHSPKATESAVPRGSGRDENDASNSRRVEARKGESELAAETVANEPKVSSRKFL